MTSDTRAKARGKGLRIAAKVAGLGGLALAAVGVVEAHATAAPAAGTSTASATPASAGPSLPLELWGRQTRGGNCGCSPCWGPPAPPPARRRA
jgi:hypothetical protein